MRNMGESRNETMRVEEEETSMMMVPQNVSIVSNKERSRTAEMLGRKRGAKQFQTLD